YTTNIDQVDNCLGGWSFSRLFGDMTSGIGPFDPAFASTLLSDGRLNAADAPMPALEVIYNSAGGMGGFDDATVLNRKACVYNRNSDPADNQCVATGSHESDPHALFAPYYGEYIPSTSRDPFGAASGIDSAFQTDNFNAFPGVYGAYNFWYIAETLAQ